MPKQITSIRIFLSSPRDVLAERSLIEATIDHWNKRLSREKLVVFDLVNWDTDIVPGFGDYPQDVVNTQVGDDFDILIALFWARLGTETEKALSGSVEEYDRALERLKAGEDINISFYFKTSNPELDQIDPEQLTKLRDFKDRVPNDGGLYKEFDSDDALRLSIELLLDQAANKWTNDHGSNNAVLNSSPIDTDPVAKKSDELVPDEKDVGIIDVMEGVEELSSSLTETSKEIGSKLEHLTGKIHNSTEDIRDLSKYGKPPLSALKPIIGRISKDMDDFSEFTEGVQPNFEHNTSEMVQKVRQLSSLMLDFDPDDEELKGFEDTVSYLKDEMKSASTALKALANNVEGLQRLTAGFNVAKRRFVKNCQRLAGNMDLAVNILDQVIEQLPTEQF